jgi:peptidoglycan/LPS O-acetylase OafA/YrhL
MKGRVEQLDGLRGIFSIMVIAHHHNAFKDSIFYNNFLVINSSLFVDFFFVLSGFVIALNYWNRITTTKSFGDFLKKRMIRLYPLLVYTELVFIIAGLLGEQSALKNVNNLGLNYYLYTALDTLTFMGSTPVFGARMSINYPAWSISSEMISYFIFGLVLLFSLKYRNLIFGLITLLCGIFIIIQGEYMLAYEYGFVRGMLCFSMGIFVSEILKWKEFELSRWEWPYIIFLLLSLYWTHVYDLNLLKLVFPVLFGCGIIIFASSKGIISRMLSSKVFQYLGKISYSIYLNHAIVIMTIHIILFRILKIAPSELNVGFSLLASILLTILYSHFTYEIIENRFSQYLKRKFN